MSRLEIQIRRPEGREHRMVLGRFASLVVTAALALLAIVVLALAVVFGYVLAGVALAVLLVALVIAILNAAWSSLWRRR